MVAYHYPAIDAVAQLVRPLEGCAMRKAPDRTNDTGAYGEQLSFLPTPPFCPSLPPADTNAEQALIDLIERPRLMQIDWLRERKSWRLSAAIFDLNQLGWEVQSHRTDKGQAIYSLNTKAKQTAYRLLNETGRALAIAELQKRIKGA